MTFKKQIRLVRIILAATAGAALVLVLTVLSLSVWRDPAPNLAKLTVWAPKPFNLGTLAEVRVDVDCPYYRLPRLPLTVVAPAGMQTLDFAKRRLVGVGVFGWRWRCVAALQPVELGKREGGSVTVAFTPGRREANDAVTAPLPPFTVEPHLKPQDSSLALAPLIPKSWLPASWQWWHYVALGVLLLILALAFWLLYRRREAADLPPPPPPWETAQDALQELEGALPLEPERFFVRYTDVVRHYGDARFDLHATEATTPELLERLRRLSELTFEQRQAVSAVLDAADRIKFARADATQDELRNALGVARRFVSETTPVPAAADAGTENGKRKTEEEKP
jgi:hypothetical protein